MENPITPQVRSFPYSASRRKFSDIVVVENVVSHEYLDIPRFLNGSMAGKVCERVHFFGFFHAVSQDAGVMLLRYIIRNS